MLEASTLPQEADCTKIESMMDNGIEAATSRPCQKRSTSRAACIWRLRMLVASKCLARRTPKPYIPKVRV